jgi:5-hydroxyisourate hydrolase-like protein (transthyretin family)
MLDRLSFVTHGFGSVKVAPHVLEAKAGRKRSSSLQKNIFFDIYIPLSSRFNELDNAYHFPVHISIRGQR